MHDTPPPAPTSPAARHGAGAALLLALLPVAVLAQEPFVDAVDVHVVNVEVVVTDADGEPVADLGREDFTLYEDGEPVEITNFYAVDRRAASAGEAASGPRPEDATRQLHLVLLVDQDGLEPQNRSLLFAALREDLDRAFELDGQVMVAALDDGLEVVVPFTDDRDRVLSALDELSRVASAEGLDVEERLLVGAIDRAPTPPSREPEEATAPPREGEEEGGSVATVVYDNSEFEGAVDHAFNLASSIRANAEREVAVARHRLAATARLVDTLSGLPGRKAVLFLSEGVSRRPADLLVEVWREKFDRWLDLNSRSLTPIQMLDKERVLRLVGTRDFDASAHVSELLRHAASRRVAFYPILVAGRSSLQGTSSLTAARSLEHVATIDQQESMLELAEGTGGIAWTTPRNLGTLLDRLAQDFEQFYSLGYTPPRPDDDDYRKIAVEVRRPGLELRHVDGYRVQDPVERLRDLTLAALHFGTTEDNPLGVSLVAAEAEPAESDRSLVTVLVRIPFDRMLLVPQEERYAGRLRLVVIVRDEATGGTSRPHEVYLPVSFPKYLLSEALTKSAGYPMRLSLRKGVKQIAVGLRDELAQVDATARLAVRVPPTG